MIARFGNQESARFSVFHHTHGGVEGAAEGVVREDIARVSLRDDEPPGDPGMPGHTYIGMMLTDMQLMIPALGGNVDALKDVLPYDTYQP